MEICRLLRRMDHTTAATGVALSDTPEITPLSAAVPVADIGDECLPLTVSEDQNRPLGMLGVANRHAPCGQWGNFHTFTAGVAVAALPPRPESRRDGANIAVCQIHHAPPRSRPASE